MAREQRRLAAIVAADVVGYSRLMGRDESGTLARLREHRKQRLEPILARHGGRLVKLTGDGALSEFHSAVDAVSAAIEFQQSVAEANREIPEATAIVFRIGVHLGDLIVDGDDLYGDGVNVAARLEAEALAGGIVVSGDVHNAVAGKVKATLHDLGALSLKNIDRPVQAFRAEWIGEDWAKQTATPSSSSAATLSSHEVLPALALPDKPSIAVLPFQNMSGDAEQEYFTDGISEDLITELSRFRELFVIARNSSFTYKGKAVNIKQVGRELGVRYVLEGSIRRSGNRVRITAQLIEAPTGAHVWAERFDRVLEDIFEVQEEVTRAIVAALVPEIAATEHTRAMRRRPGDISAYENAVRAWSDALDAHQATDHDLVKRAVDGAIKALAIDPNSVLAWQSLCFARQLQGYHRFMDRDEAAREAQEAGDRAVALDGADARSHALRAHCSFTARDFERQPAALIQARRAHEMNPNDTFVLFLLGNLEASAGDPAKAIELCHRILRLNPRDTRIHMIHTLLAYACVGAKRWAEGAAWADRTVNDAPRSVPGHTNLITCLVGMGEIEKAKAAYRRARALLPEQFGGPLTHRPGSARHGAIELALLFRRIAAGELGPEAAEPYR